MRAWHAAILVLLLCTLPLPAPLVPGPHADERTEAASLVFVGKVQRGSTFASGSRVSHDLILRVDRVLKGVAPGGEIAAHLEGQAYFLSPQPKQSAVESFPFGVWFVDTRTTPFTVLSRGGNYGELRFAAVELLEEAGAGESGDTPQGRVANEIVSTLRLVVARDPLGLSPMQAGLYRSLLESLRSLNAEARGPAYRRVADLGPGYARAAGIEGMIRASEPEGILRAASEWDQLGTGKAGVIGALMEFHSGRDPEAVRALAELALREPTEPQLKEMASWSLRAIHSKETLPALNAFLDHSYVGVRHMAISGFCLYVLGAPVVATNDTVTVFAAAEGARWATAETRRYCRTGGAIDPKADLDAYAAFWKTWWSTNRREIEAQ